MSPFLKFNVAITVIVLRYSATQTKSVAVLRKWPSGPDLMLVDLRCAPSRQSEGFIKDESSRPTPIHEVMGDHSPQHKAGS